MATKEFYFTCFRSSSILCRSKYVIFSFQRGYDVEGCYLGALTSRFQRFVNFYYCWICLIFRRADIVGRGFSGYTTRLCLPLLKILYPNAESLQNTAAFFIFLGANDASFGWQKVDLPEYKSNLCHMISYLQVSD